RVKIAAGELPEAFRRCQQPYEAALSKRCRADAIAGRFLRAHSPSSLTGSSSERPSLVSSYSTLGGTVGKTVRVTRPSRSSPRKVSVSMRCEIEPSARRNSLKRLGPAPSVETTSTVHLSPTRARTSLTARQSSGSCRLPGIRDVPSCGVFAVIYLALVSIRNLEIEGPMGKLKLGILVGSNRRESINRKLAQALARLGGSAFDAKFIQIDDLPIYNQDNEAP